MGERTAIGWTDHTFNPWWGCTKVSSGCKNCYAEKVSARFGGDHWGKGKPRREFWSKHWLEPLKWDAKAKKTGIRKRVFSGSMCDVFDLEGPEVYRANLFRLIGKTPSLDWLLLTKRPELIGAFIPDEWIREPGFPWNVWIGTSVEDRAAKTRIAHIHGIPSAIRFLSCEPLIEDLGGLDLRGINWVIAGAESGPGARPMNEDWVRSIRDQCQAAGVAFFYKQRIDGGRKVHQPLFGSS